MSILNHVWQAVSADRIWLQANLTWKDVDSMPYYPRRTDFYYSVLVAALLSALRFTLDRVLFQPIANTMWVFGLQNPSLEKAFKGNTVDARQIQAVSRELNWTVHKVESWLRKKRNVLKKQKKFTETCWRLLFMGFITVFGFVLACGNSCATNTATCFPSNIRDEIVTGPRRWYFLLEVGFYLFLCASIFTDAKRKDFKIMMAHHALTFMVFLIWWIANVYSYALVIMVCHDIGDVPLEGAKLCKYLKKTGWANVLFGVFFVVWCLSRLIYFPFLIHGLLVHGAPYCSDFIYYAYTGVHLSLLFLHLIWTWMILRVLLTLLKDKEAKDVRSDSEMDSSGDEDSKNK